MRRTLEYALVLLAAAAALAGPVAVAAPRVAADPAAPVIVLASPWADAEALVTAAGGRLVGPVQPRLARVAAGPAPDFAARLRAEGAWLVVAAAPVLALCGVRL